MLYLGSASPFLLNANVMHHLEKYVGTHSATHCYFAIYLRGRCSVWSRGWSAYKLYLKSKEILKNGSFNRRKFTTSCPSVQDKINNAEALDTSSQAEGSLDEMRPLPIRHWGEPYHTRQVCEKVLVYARILIPIVLCSNCMSLPS